MGKKTASTSAGGSSVSSAKTKKQLMKEAIAREQAQLKLIKDARNVADLFVGMDPFRRYERNGLALELKQYAADTTPKELKSWAYDLTKHNMITYYDNSGGWHAFEKRSELNDTDMRYIIAFDTAATTTTTTTAINSSSYNNNNNNNNNSTDGGVIENAEQQHQLAATGTAVEPKPVAFATFKFDLDEGREVLYLYELQISKPYAKKGLGKFMMQTLEFIARRNKMKGIVLTVFKDNHGAMEFYKKLKYTIDPSSPSVVVPERSHEFAYEIMSKMF